MIRQRVAINERMTKHPAVGDTPVKRPRGRPPKPGGKIPKAAVQRAYRARLAAAGKIVRLVDATAFKAMQDGNGTPASPGDDSDLAVVRAWNHELREELENALSKLTLREEEAAWLRQRNAQLEADLKREQQHHNIALKDNIVLKQQLEQAAPKRRERAAARPKKGRDNS